jgi:hypothetical protein
MTSIDTAPGTGVTITISLPLAQHTPVGAPLRSQPIGGAVHGRPLGNLSRLYDGTNGPLS